VIDCVLPSGRFAVMVLPLTALTVKPPGPPGCPRPGPKGRPPGPKGRPPGPNGAPPRGRIPECAVAVSVDVVVVVVVGAAKALLASKKLALKPATPMPSSDCRRVSGSSHHCPPVLVWILPAVFLVHCHTFPGRSALR